MIHSVQRVARLMTKEVSDFLRVSTFVEGKMKSVQRTHQQMVKSDLAKQKTLWAKVMKDASSAIDMAVRLHKKLSGTSEFSKLSKSIRALELTLVEPTLPAFQAKQVVTSLEELYGDVQRIATLASKGYLE